MTKQIGHCVKSPNLEYNEKMGYESTRGLTKGGLCKSSYAAAHILSTSATISRR